MASRYWIGGTGNWSDSAHWSAASGGAGGASVPTSTDDAFLDGSSGAGILTVDAPAQNCQNLDCTGYIGTLTFAASLNINATAGGQCKFSSGMILNGSATLDLQGSPGATGATLTSAGLTIPRINVIAGSTSVWKLADALTVSLSFILSSGTFDTNNQTCVLNTFSSSNASLRTLTLGSSVITITGNGTSWDCTVASNLIITANTAILTFTSASITFRSGGLNWNGLSVIFNGGGSSALGNGGTYNNITYIGTTNKTDQFNFTPGVSVTVNGIFTVTGQSVVNRVLLGTSILGSIATLIASSTSFSNVDFQDIAFGGVSSAPSTISLTSSGNEVTDATRIAGASLGVSATGNMLDGQLMPGGVGIRRTATNLFRRGQCDTNADTIINKAGTTCATDATLPAPFSPQSLKVICDGTAAGQGVFSQTAAGQAIAAGTICVGSTYFKGIAGQSYQMQVAMKNTDATTTFGTQPTFNATGAWQLLTPPSVTVATGKTGDWFAITITLATTRTDTFHVAHAMLEKGQSVVAPYVATSGGATATHAAGRVQAPASLLNATQGWVAMRVRPNWAGTATPHTNPTLFSWGSTGAERIQVFWNGTTGWRLIRYSGGNNLFDLTKVDTIAAGDLVTVIAAWTATSVQISVDGSVFTSYSPAGAIPSLPATFDLGSDHISLGREFDGDVLWLACGTGTLSDTDASTINAYGNTVAAQASIPGNATGVWNALNVGGSSIGDCLGNSGIVFDTPTTQSWVGTSGGNWSDITKWTSRVPLPQDDVVINQAFIASQTITTDMPRSGKNVSFAGTTGNPSISQPVAITWFGNIVFSSGTVWPNSAKIITFAGRGAQTITANGVSIPGGGRGLNISAPGGSYTMQDSWVGWTTGLTLIAGTFDANNFNVSCWAFGANGSLTRVVNMGSGIWTLVANSQTTNSWIVSGSGLTVNPGTSTISMVGSGTGTNLAFAGGGFTYYDVQYKPSGIGALIITGNNIFNNLDFEGTTARTITLPASGIQTVRGLLTLQGASGQLLSLVSATPGTVSTIVLPAGATMVSSFYQLTPDVLVDVSRIGGAVLSSVTGTVKKVTASKNGGAISIPELGLTVTGGILTDADRFLGIQGDTLPLGSGYGVWEATVNLSPFSGGPSMAAVFQATSLTVDIKHVLFSGAPNDHMKLVTPGITFGGGGEGLSCATAARGAAINSTVYTCSYWVYSEVGGEQVSVGIDQFIGNSYIGTVGTTNYTLSIGWNRLIATGTTNVVGITHVGPQIRTRAVAQAITIWVVGQQIEQKSIATPVVRTNGSTVARSASRIQPSASLLSVTQGWFAAYVGMGVPYNAASGQRVIAVISIDANNYIKLYEEPANGEWTLQIADGGTSRFPIFSASPDTFQPGAMRVVIGKWTNTNGQVSLNGAVFGTAVTRATTPSGSAPVIFDIGSSGGAGNFLNGDCMWLMCGMGALSDTDAATINGYGNTLPDIRSLPASWGVTGLWRAKDNLIQTLPQGRGTKAVTTAKVAGAISSIVSGTSKFITTRKTGGGVILDSSGGTYKRATIVGKFGGARTELWAGVTSHRSLAVKIGGLINAIVAGGTFRALKPRTGGGKSVLVEGVLKRLAFVHTGGGISNLIEGAIRNTARQKAGGVVSILKSGGARRTVPSKTGGLKSAGTPGGTYQKLAIHIGGGKSILITGAAKVTHYFYIKLGGSNSSLSSGAFKNWLTFKTGGGKGLSSGGGVSKKVGPPMMPGSGNLNPYIPFSAVESMPDLFSTVDHAAVILNANIEEAEIEEIIVKRPDLLKVRV